MQRVVYLGLPILIFVLLALAVAAQSAPPAVAPPATAPPADRSDLSRRLLGSVPARLRLPVAVGERAIFPVSDHQTQAITPVEAVRLIGDDMFSLWLQTDAVAIPGSAQRFAAAYRDQLTPTLRELWGHPPPPGLPILFTTHTSPGTAAYADLDSPYGPLLVINLRATGPDLTSPYALSLTAHELQHLIRARFDPTEATWLNEGYSLFTERQLGLYDAALLQFEAAYRQRPGIALADWSDEGSLARHYGAAGLFVNAVYDRFGVEGVRELSTAPGDGWAAVRHLLAIEGVPLADFLGDWILDTLTPPIDSLPVTALPHVHVNADALPTATTFYDLTPLADALTDAALTDAALTDAALTLDLRLPQPAQLLPLPVTENVFLFAPVSENSNPSLTRRFDLRGVSQARLHYRLWHDLEAGYDFAYVSVSVDDGQTWALLQTPHMVAPDASGRAYGPGYTGTWDDWRSDTLDLDAYTGQQILLRFEAVADGAIAHAGIALDDLHLPEIGYVADFTSDEGGWQRHGWQRTRNQQPAWALVQLIQWTPQGRQVTRWQLDGSASVTLERDPTAERVLLAVTPFAEVPFAGLPYALTLYAADE